MVENSWSKGLLDIPDGRRNSKFLVFIAVSQTLLTYFFLRYRILARFPWNVVSAGFI